MHTLQAYGWNDERAATWIQSEHMNTIPARIVADFGHTYKIVVPERVSARISGALEHKAKTVDMPKIGDWVAAEIHGDGSATIQAVLPRSSEIVRKQAGRSTDKQVVAANVDVAFIMQSLDDDFSVERLERYIFQLAKQHIKTIILLNKADVANDAADKQVQLASLGVPSFIISAREDKTITQVEQKIIPGQTAVIVGSSGTGKSTLTNRLIGEHRQATAAIREKDSKGRHTTVHRELFILPKGGMIIDTPGIRELQLWGDVSELDKSFPDIANAQTQCRFKNCTHSNEDGCVVRASLDDGLIDNTRYKTYLGFKQELEALERKRQFIDERRSQQTKESAKRRHRRAVSKMQSDDIE